MYKTLDKFGWVIQERFLEGWAGQRGKMESDLDTYTSKWEWGWNEEVEWVMGQQFKNQKWHLEMPRSEKHYLRKTIKTTLKESFFQSYNHISDYLFLLHQERGRNALLPYLCIYTIKMNFLHDLLVWGMRGCGDSDVEASGIFSSSIGIVKFCWGLFGRGQIMRSLKSWIIFFRSKITS